MKVRIPRSSRRRRSGRKRRRRRGRAAEVPTAAARATAAAKQRRRDSCRRNGTAPAGRPGGWTPRRMRRRGRVGGEDESRQLDPSGRHKARRRSPAACAKLAKASGCPSPRFRRAAGDDAGAAVGWSAASGRGRVGTTCRGAGRGAPGGCGGYARDPSASGMAARATSTDLAPRRGCSRRSAGGSREVLDDVGRAGSCRSTAGVLWSSARAWTNSWPSLGPPAPARCPDDEAGVVARQRSRECRKPELGARPASGRGRVRVARIGTAGATPRSAVTWRPGDANDISISTWCIGRVRPEGRRHVLRVAVRLRAVPADLDQR